MHEIIIEASVKGQRPLLQNAFSEESNVSKKKGHPLKYKSIKKNFTSSNKLHFFY
ncbi:hypothetical protein MHK_004523 [Candidatus Magnetomorum sp. HK-1]|nr:hypothetical protein MHK_004523 [Candidatus Magnetomorum sp. HK-1]